MKTLFGAVVILFVASSLSALGTEYRAMPSSDDGCTINFQDTTKKDKKKKDTTKRDTTLVQYHR